MGNPREFLQAEKQEQEMAEACKRLIKNCIICWNYLYLSQKFADLDDPANREAFLKRIANAYPGTEAETVDVTIRILVTLRSFTPVTGIRG